MLKSHLQPIVAYFSNATTATTDKQTASPQNSKRGLLQSGVDYYGTGTKRLGVPDRQEGHVPSQSATWLQRLWHQLITISPDPRIRQRVARDGQSYWYAYDPTTDRSHTFFSEEEVYQWLEQRYYQ